VVEGKRRGSNGNRIDRFSGAMVGFWHEGRITSENGHNGVFIQNWVGRTWENGQHDNGRFIQSLMYNGPLGVIW
jgi:hypothetical protein